MDDSGDHEDNSSEVVKDSENGETIDEMNADDDTTAENHAEDEELEKGEVQEEDDNNDDKVDEEKFNNKETEDAEEDRGEDVDAQQGDEGDDEIQENENTTDNLEYEGEPIVEVSTTYNDDTLDYHDETDDRDGNDDREGNDDGAEDDKSGIQDEESRQQNGIQELSDEDIDRCRHIFNRKAIHGRLDLKGFKILFRLLGEVASSDELEKIFVDGGQNDGNTIDFEGFSNLYSKFRQEEQDRKDSIRASIDTVFPDCNGEYVELKKVRQLLMKLQQPDLDMRLVREKSDLGARDIKHLVSSMDTHGNGLISKQELVNVLCQRINV